MRRSKRYPLAHAPGPARRADPVIPCTTRQAAERLISMNDPAKGGSAYLQAKITNARNALVAPPEEPAAAAPEPPKPEPPKSEPPKSE